MGLDIPWISQSGYFTAIKARNQVKLKYKNSLLRISLLEGGALSSLCMVNSSSLHFFIIIKKRKSLSHVRLFVTPGTVTCQASLSITNYPSVLQLMSMESVMPSYHLILCRPLLLPSIFPSIRVFSNESVLRIRWPKYWSFSFRISPFSEYSGLISFGIDWFDLLAVQGTLKSLL